MSDHHQKNTDEEPLVSEVLTVEHLREYSRAQIEQLSKNVFKTLQATNTESLVVYLITISLDPIMRAYLDHPTKVDELIKKIWPNEYAIFKTYLEKDKLSINRLSADVQTLLDRDDFAMPSRILCNGTEQKSLEARSGLTLKPSHFSPLHKIRDGIRFCSSHS